MAIFCLLRSSYSIIIFIIYISGVVKSDQINCKNVQCPPDINCPSDSISHVLYESLIESSAADKYYPNQRTTNSIDSMSIDGKNNNDADKNESELKFNENNINEHISKINKQIYEPKLNTNPNNNNNNNNNQNNVVNTNYHHHSLIHRTNKRSIQYKRKESIKIVPGDYISLVPENILHHDSQDTQNNHKKRKRSITTQSNEYNNNNNNNNHQINPIIPLSSQNLIAYCCPKQICLCKGKCIFPKCERFGKITIETEVGNGKPGNCCSKYECIDKEPDCTNLKLPIRQFWIKDCIKCECISGHKFCHNNCDSDNFMSKKECFSSKRQRPYEHGQIWKDDDCTECECDDGEKKCQIPFCKSLNCTKQFKKPNNCCPECIPDEPTTTTISTPTIFTINTNSAELLTEKSTTESIEMTPKPTIPSTTTTIPTTIFTITTVTIPSSSTAFSTAILIPSVNPISSNSNETKIVEESSLQHHHHHQQLPTNASIQYDKKLTISDSPVMCSNQSVILLNSTSSTENTFTSSTANENKILKLLGITKENLILYAVIVGLSILCAIFVALYLREIKKRRTSYRSIPNSDSNLNQTPPKSIKTP